MIILFSTRKQSKWTNEISTWRHDFLLKDSKNNLFQTWLLSSAWELGDCLANIVNITQSRGSWCRPGAWGEAVSGTELLRPQHWEECSRTLCKYWSSSFSSSDCFLLLSAAPATLHRRRSPAGWRRSWRVGGRARGMITMMRRRTMSGTSSACSSWSRSPSSCSPSFLTFLTEEWRIGQSERWPHHQYYQRQLSVINTFPGLSGVERERSSWSGATVTRLCWSSQDSCSSSFRWGAGGGWSCHQPLNSLHECVWLPLDRYLYVHQW